MSEESIFIPRGMDARMVDFLSYKMQEGAVNIDLSRVGITKIPDEIGNMVQLEKLILSENKIQSLPETIGLLSNLKTLYLFHNQLTSLPKSMYDMKQLQWLGLSGNMLSKRTLRELKTALPYTRIYWEKREAA